MFHREGVGPSDQAKVFFLRMNYLPTFLHNCCKINLFELPGFHFFFYFVQNYDKLINPYYLQLPWTMHLKKDIGLRQQPVVHPDQLSAKNISCFICNPVIVATGLKFNVVYDRVGSVK